MTSFEFFSVALSLVLGLGITRILLGGLGVFRARQRQNIHWIPVVWAVTVFVYQIQYWWAIFELKETLLTWTQGVFATLLSLSILLFVAGALVLPASADQERQNLYDYFDQSGRWALLAVTGYLLLSIWTNWFLFGTELLSAMNVTIAGVAGLTVLAFASANRRVLGVLTAGHLIWAVYGYLFLAPTEYQ